MFDYLDQKISAVENGTWVTRTEALSMLRTLSLDDFGLLMLSMPNGHYPRLSSILPAMASEQTQKNWTGASGPDLLRQSIDFVRIASTRVLTLTGRPLNDATILDYGCGYGRLLRLMMFFSDPENLHGCDPWDRSLDLCSEAGIDLNLTQTDYLPETLPYPQASFDYAYAFSVFTHTSERATRTALKALHPTIKPGGLATITLRPKEYWGFHAGLSEEEQRSLIETHEQTGFSFKPHQRTPVDGDVTYGDTTIDLSALERLGPDWRVMAYDRPLNDPFQLSVHLQPV